MNYPEPSDFLLVFSGICWMIVYIEAVRAGFRDRSYAMPFWALGLNYAWEVMHSVLAWKEEGLALQVAINMIWALLDLIVLFTYFRFGRRYFKERAGLFIPWSLMILAVSVVIQIAFIMQFGIYQGRAYAAFLQNLLMSVLFINMLSERGSTEGQSLVIAAGKWLGTLAPTILFGILGTDVFNGPNRFLLVIGLLCSLFDLIYIIRLARMVSDKKRDTAPIPPG